MMLTMALTPKVHREYPLSYEATSSDSTNGISSQKLYGYALVYKLEILESITKVYLFLAIMKSRRRRPLKDVSNLFTPAPEPRQVDLQQAF